VLSVLLRYTDSDYPFGIFKLFLSKVVSTCIILCIFFFNFFFRSFKEDKMEKLISIEDGKITKMDLVVLITNFGWVCIN
jgi:hypothetical protein